MGKLWYEEQFTNENGEFVYEESPLKAIRNKCLYDCAAGYRTDVDNCQCTKCFLYPFRHGKNPFRKKRELTDEQRAAIAERMKAGRENKSILDE